MSGVRRIMRVRSLLTIVVLAVLALAVAACGGDDGGSPEGTSEAPTVVDGQGGELTPDFRDVPARGSGTITVGDETFEYDVTICIITNDSGYTVGGPGQTADGKPFFANAGLQAGGIGYAVVNVGTQDGFALGNPSWTAAPPADPVTQTNDELSISFTTTFDNAISAEAEAVEGTVDASCQ
jgi:hypothetical protein